MSFIYRAIYLQSISVRISIVILSILFIFSNYWYFSVWVLFTKRKTYNYLMREIYCRLYLYLLEDDVKLKLYISQLWTIIF